MPYGLGLADWDVLLSDAEVALFFQQLAIMNTAAAHTLFLHIHPKDVGRMWSAMESNGYQHVHMMYVYKPQHNTVGTHQYLNAVDQVIVGYNPSRELAKPYFSNPNPLFRHNLLYSHSSHHKRSMPASGNMSVVNVTEKHPGISMQLGRVHSSPGGRALVIGAGSGSEVIGFNRAGLDVVALEKDPHQFQAICARLVSEQENVETVDEKVALEQQQVLAQMTRTSQFQVVAKQHKSKASSKARKLSKSSNPLSLASPPAQTSNRRILPKNCVACGQNDDEKFGTCASDDCTDMHIHVACMRNCQDCSAIFCKPSCLDKHTCEKTAKSKSPSSVEPQKPIRKSHRTKTKTVENAGPKA